MVGCLVKPSHLLLTSPAVFARGMTISNKANPYLLDDVRSYWTKCGQALDQFNSYIANDPRVDVTVIPVFDGVSQIKWKLDYIKQNPDKFDKEHTIS